MPVVFEGTIVNINTNYQVNILLPGLEKETCLIPLPPQQQVESARTYTLLTENLVFTQLTLHLGFHRYESLNSIL